MRCPVCHHETPDPVAWWLVPIVFVLAFAGGAITASACIVSQPSRRVFDPEVLPLSEPR